MQTVDGQQLVSTTTGPATYPAAAPWLAAQRRWLVPLLLFLGVFGVYAATAARSLVSVDVHAASVGAWRIASTGKPWLDHVNLEQLGDPGHKINLPWLKRAPNGHIVAQRMAGPIIAGIPFYALLDRGTDPRDFSIVAGGIAAAFWTALAALFMFLALRRHLPESLSVAGALVFGLATPTWSVSADGLWTHTLTQLGIAGAAYALSRDRWWLVGVFLGVGMFGRPHVALIAAAVGLGMAWSRRDWRIALGVGVPTAAALGFLEVWNRVVFGSWSIGGAYAGNGVIGTAVHGQSSQWLNYLGFLVAPDRGFLEWSLAFLVLIPALVRAWRDMPDWVRWLPLGGLLYTIAQLRLDTFTGGDAYYGYRLGLELLTCLMPALALSMRRLGAVQRLVFGGLVGAQFAAISVGAVTVGLFVPEQQVWTDNSFWVALRHEPLFVGPYLGCCVLVGILVAVELRRRHTTLAAVSVG